VIKILPTTESRNISQIPITFQNIIHGFQENKMGTQLKHSMATGRSENNWNEMSLWKYHVNSPCFGVTNHEFSVKREGLWKQNTQKVLSDTHTS